MEGNISSDKLLKIMILSVNLLSASIEFIDVDN